MNAASVSRNSGSFHLGFENKLVVRFSGGALSQIFAERPDQIASRT
jgi:hypothetical protein